MTKCKHTKKAIIIFALATILLIHFIEEYYNQHKISSYTKYFFHKSSKIANQQPPHESPSTTSQENFQQHQQKVKQIIHSHQHAFIFKTTHINLKKDTHDCQNL